MNSLEGQKGVEAQKKRGRRKKAMVVKMSLAREDNENEACRKRGKG